MKKTFLAALLCIVLVSACTGAPAESQYLVEGREAFTNQEYSLALQQFKLAIEEHPDSVEAYSLAADILLRKHDYEGTIQLLQEGLQRTGNDVTLRLLIAEAFRNKGEYESALEHYRAAWEADKSSVRAWEGLVRSLAATGRTDELKEVVRTLPDNAPAHIMVQVYVLRGEENAAAALDAVDAGEYENLVTLMKESVQGLDGEQSNLAKTRLAYVMLQTGYHELVIPLMEEVIADNAFYETPYLYRGIALLERNNLTGAEADFRKVLELEPSTRDARLLLIRSLFEQGVTEEPMGIAAGMPVEQFTPEQREFLLDLLIRYEAYETAQGILDKLTAASVEFDNEMRLAALRISIEAGKFDAADQYAAALLDTEESDARYLAWAGYAKFKGGDKNAAVEQFTLAKAADRTNPWIYLFEGELAISNEDYGAAQELLDRAIDLDLGGEVTERAKQLRSQL
ncbi:MAG: tetratricopeptide repeat protein [candidate division WS6 bacterium OLB20]|uniref:Tetratricopeptide repeat protein n=1 Tax=candidate division WS6 bacterium OLB20 TaxID=1617426 RepID=A0A136M056_9BACT|nr:MAG: tetratricopeptide repeat protein [candidate division WS6 bacterium OLB20]